MRYVFLDIDGVLLPLPYREEVGSMSICQELRTRVEENPVTAGHLCRIVRIGNAKVIVSSSWRKMMSFSLLQWAFNNTIEIEGVTECDGDGRGSEIHHYLKRRPANRFVVLDDDTLDMGDLMPHVVETDSKVGLTAENAEAAIELLR